MSPLTLVLLAPFLSADMNAAARELARNVAAAVAHEPVAFSMRNASSLEAREADEIRHIFESELQTGAAVAEIQLTISENLTEFLLVSEIRKPGARQVLFESWPRTRAAGGTETGEKPQRVTLEKKLLWEQERPILDAVAGGESTLVLDAARVLLMRGEARQSAPINISHAWPRDPRGRLSANLAGAGAGFTAFLPGTVCQGSAGPQLTLECRDSRDPWLLAPGAIAVFDPERNLFTGHLDVEPGGPRDLAPFYSAAFTGDGWLLAGADGRAHIYSRTWESGGAIDQLGSDIAGIQTPCGPRLLATRAGSLTEPDAIQTFTVAGNSALPGGPPLEFSGPVTALWTSGSTATAVSYALETRRYAAYSLVPHCGN